MKTLSVEQLTLNVDYAVSEGEVGHLVERAMTLVSERVRSNVRFETLDIEITQSGPVTAETLADAIVDAMGRGGTA